MNNFYHFFFSSFFLKRKGIESVATDVNDKTDDADPSVIHTRFPQHCTAKKNWAMKREIKKDRPIRLFRARDENMIDTRTSTPLIYRVNLILQSVA